MERLSEADTMLHLVRGPSLPAELRSATTGETVVFMGGMPTGDLPACRCLELEAPADGGDGLSHDELLGLIFECESVVTW